jgi:hypothetical protein
MSSSSYILNQIRSRATVLRLISGFQLGRAEAEKRAAVELASERRGAKPSALITATAEPTVANARQVLIARVMAVAERMRATPARRNRLPRQAEPPTVIRPHVEDPIAAKPAPAAAPSGELQIVGVFAGRITAAQLIPDSEYRHNDPVTANWRKSLRGRSTWIG